MREAEQAGLWQEAEGADSIQSEVTENHRHPEAAWGRSECAETDGIAGNGRLEEPRADSGDTDLKR